MGQTMILMDYGYLWLLERLISAVPLGQPDSYGQQPNVETLGYCQTSLRDEYKILVALSVPQLQVRAVPVRVQNLSAPLGAQPALNLVLLSGINPANRPAETVQLQ